MHGYGLARYAHVSFISILLVTFIARNPEATGDNAPADLKIL